MFWRERELKEELVLRILNEFERTSLRQKRNCGATMVATTRTDNEFGLDAGLFGTPTSNEMWTRDEVSTAAINCKPGPPLAMKMDAVSNAIAAKQCLGAAERNASEESSNEIDFVLKLNQTMNETPTAMQLVSLMARTPNVEVLLIAERSRK